MARPLSEEDVNEVRARLAKLNASQIKDICDNYVNTIMELIMKVESIVDKNEDEAEYVELDRVRRIVRFVDTDECFIRSKDKIWEAREHILNKDADWFLNRDYSKLIKKDQKTTMIETLISIVKGKYRGLSEQEKTIFWNYGLRLLKIVASYKKLTGEK